LSLEILGLSHFFTVSEPKGGRGGKEITKGEAERGRESLAFNGLEGGNSRWEETDQGGGAVAAELEQGGGLPGLVAKFPAGPVQALKTWREGVTDVGGRNVLKGKRGWVCQTRSTAFF